MDREMTLTIEKPVAGGRMLARHEGRVVLVSGAIPGERVRARLERLSRGVAQAAVTEVLEADADRRPVAGDWTCGGSFYAHIEYSRQIRLKAEIIADTFARLGHLPLADPVAVRGSPEEGYRMRARLHVRGGRIGFFREGTHELCDPAQTGQLLPASLAVLDRAQQVLLEAQDRLVTQIELAENLRADQRLLHLDFGGLLSPAPAWLAGLEAVEGITGVTASGFGRRAPVRRGLAHVADPLHALLPSRPLEAVGLTLRRHAAAFFQANRYLLPAVVERVVSCLGEGPVVDLYGGVGLFGVCAAAASAAAVTIVEGHAANLADLKVNVAAFGERIRIVHAPVETYLHRRPHPAAASLVVDPPRTGLSREAMAGIVAWAPRRIVYVSCDVATLARDVRRLVDSGYALGHLEAFDLFPNTPHIECVAVFTR
jgi:23S rRNA (uracil1939-C5)-methyltransferase